MILEILSFITILLVLTASIVLNVFLYVKSSKAVAALLQATADKNAFAEKLSELVNEKESQSIEKTDGFLKFVSQSRDWAFQYIEEVQNGLVSFNEAILAAKEKTPKAAIKEILEANNKLQKLLPDDIQNKEK